MTSNNECQTSPAILMSNNGCQTSPAILMLKKALFLLLITGSLLLCACAGKVQAKDTHSENTEVSDGSSPESAAEYVMASLKALDLDAFNEYTDNYICTHHNWIGIPTSREYRVFNELLQPALIKGKHYNRNYRLAKKLMENLSWEITDVRQAANMAEIDMNITNINIMAVTGDYTVFLLENMAEGENLGMVSLIKDLSDLTRNMDDLFSIIDSTDAEDICTTNVTLTARQENGQWRVHVSDEFINAFMGNIDSEVYPEETIEKIKLLEDRLNEKAEKWAEEFEKNIEGLFD